MKVNVLLFARIAEAVGESQIELELPDGTIVRDAWEHLAARHPAARSAIAAAGNSAAFAVNENYVHADTHPLRDGDTLAVIPPVSGG